MDVDPLDREERDFAETVVQLVARHRRRSYDRRAGYAGPLITRITDTPAGVDLVLLVTNDAGAWSRKLLDAAEVCLSDWLTSVGYGEPHSWETHL